MIYIPKGKEPESLTAYRKEPYATYDGFSHKDEIRDALLRDQGHICAYCMRRITNNAQTMKIEHWVAQSKLGTEAEKLDYHIMLGVCDGGKGSSDAYSTCDAHRGNKDLTVNPFDPHMMDTISYTRDGIISSSDPQINDDLNTALNLNCEKAASRLVLNRKNVYAEVMLRLRRMQQTGTWKKGNIQAVARSYESKDGKHPEYVGVIRFVLKKYTK